MSVDEDEGALLLDEEAGDPNRASDGVGVAEDDEEEAEDDDESEEGPALFAAGSEPEKEGKVPESCCNCPLTGAPAHFI